MVLLSSSWWLDSSWDVETHEWQLALAPQGVDVILCLTLILPSQVVINQNLPCHLYINLEKRNFTFNKALL